MQCTTYATRRWARTLRRLVDDEDVWREVQRAEVAQKRRRRFVPHDAVALSRHKMSQRLCAVRAHVYDQELAELVAILNPARGSQTSAVTVGCRVAVQPQRWKLARVLPPRELDAAALLPAAPGMLLPWCGSARNRNCASMDSPRQRRACAPVLHARRAVRRYALRPRRGLARARVQGRVKHGQREVHTRARARPRHHVQAATVQLHQLLDA